MPGPTDAGHRLRIGLDATPLIGARTGIGRYVEHLTAALGDRADLDLRLAAFTVRGRRALADSTARVVHRPVPARLLHRAWLRGDSPSAESVLGRVDVVHGTNFVLPPPRHAAGVLTVHDLAFDRFPELVDETSRRLRVLVPRGLARAAVVLTPSRAIAEELAERYPAVTDRIAVTPLGVDEAWFDPPPPPGPGSAMPAEYLIAVGTREPRKGLDVLLAAYRMLLVEDPDVAPLVLIGPPGWGPSLELAGLGSDRVLLPGYVGQDALRTWVAGACALVYPSRYEGFGLPPLEALAAGTQVVASDLPCVREVVGGHARLVEPGDASALAEAIRVALDDQRSAEEVAAAREHARSFTWRRCAEATAQSYHAAVS